jgi:hypothetical protein
MKEIDWSKAPEGATHAGRAREGLICWYKISETGYYFFSYEPAGCDFEGWDCGDGSSPSHLPLIPRPLPTWNGEGLPPVGTVCEMKDDRGLWLKVEIIASHAGYSHGWSDVCAQNFFADDPQDFRPIRTAEKVEADRRKKVISDLKSLFPQGIEGFAGGIEAIYEAGYRKP